MRFTYVLIGLPPPPCLSGAQLRRGLSCPSHPAAAKRPPEHCQRTDWEAYSTPWEVFDTEWDGYSIERDAFSTERDSLSTEWDGYSPERDAVSPGRHPPPRIRVYAAWCMQPGICSWLAGPEARR